jgi:FMN phosphatase YigB (HAD superfamily)
MKLHLEVNARAELMKEYLSLKPFPEVKQTLSALSEIPEAILSNGNPKMLRMSLRIRGSKGHFLNSSASTR